MAEIKLLPKRVCTYYASSNNKISFIDSTPNSLHIIKLPLFYVGTRCMYNYKFAIHCDKFGNHNLYQSNGYQNNYTLYEFYKMKHNKFGKKSNSFNVDINKVNKLLKKLLKSPTSAKIYSQLLNCPLRDLEWIDKYDDPTVFVINTFKLDKNTDSMYLFNKWINSSK